MKTIFYTFLILLNAITFGCNSKSGHLSLATIDNTEQYTFEASYSKEKLPQLKNYLDKEWPAKISLNQDVDLILLLNTKDKLNFNASPGKLKLMFDKKDNSIQGYLKAKKLAAGISGALK